MKQRNTSCELKIAHLKEEDSGEYSCVCGNQTTSAMVRVEGMDICQMSFLHLLNHAVRIISSL